MCWRANNTEPKCVFLNKFYKIVETDSLVKNLKLIFTGLFWKRRDYLRNIVKIAMSLYIDPKFMFVSCYQNMPVGYALDLATEIQQF